MLDMACLSIEFEDSSISHLRDIKEDSKCQNVMILGG